MSGLETAIRNALERSDRTNAETRARIYQSARQALEASLRKQDIDDPDALAAQRHRLEATIRTIETEERARTRPAASAPPAAPAQRPASPEARPVATPARPPADMGEVRGETRRDRPQAAGVQGDKGDKGDLGELGGMRAERRDTFAAEPEEQAAAAGSVGGVATLDVRPDAGGRQRRRRGFYSRMFISCVLLAAVGMGVWWIYTSGLLMSDAQRDTSVANPPATARGEDFDGETAEGGTAPADAGALKTLGPQAGFSADWLDVFKPDDIAKITTRSNAKVDMVSDGGGASVRIASASADADGTVRIEIPADVLGALAGKRSTIALTVQSDSDTPTQISVECAFASLGDCGRHRFTATQERTDALYQVTFDRSLAPSTAGHLVINSDLEGKGRAVKLFAVRILPGQ